ncbi:hypothetical protein JTE90_015062 [Oedothorax gibbosus]|uniref:Uncharacterized protein n=1 Tax=Oedothorax gibbosus TaxID=931172 RepID=A0AAV6TE48_9ARAC|nr:hypothetical protein JTE90_015062 [Oedothorax gibbosus]
MEPFPLSPQGLTGICYYHQDLHRWRSGGGSARPLLKRTPPDPPTHCGVNLHEGSSAVAAGIGPTREASSISATWGELRREQYRWFDSLRPRPRSDDRFARRTATDLHRVSLARCPGIVHHPFGSQTCALKLRTPKWNAAGLRCAPPAREGGIPNAADLPRFVLSFRRRVSRPIDSRTC